jgi:hypothetical protein
MNGIIDQLGGFLKRDKFGILTGIYWEIKKLHASTIISSKWY